ncbi:MAG: carbamoyltransferase HypF [Desulfobulbus sp.]|jgi:hydrogenase maturation protein HypF
MCTASPAAIGLVISIQGRVQGVGFRPFVFRLAHAFGLSGTVSNNADGVRIEVSGAPPVLERFVRALRIQAPPMARISEMTILPGAATTEQEQAFRILPSRKDAPPLVQVAPDIAACSDCLAEIADPVNRRFRYPFTNCTNCGPRFSIVERIPYDRCNTSMRMFSLCPACDREYHDPLDRRFHAQPNACPVCGPHLSWYGGDGQLLAEGDAVGLDLAAQALARGEVVAIKGLGGMHLAVDACLDPAVERLRARKRRPAKPLAVMVRDLAVAARFCRISEAEAALLNSPEHPVVLLDRLPGTALADSVAPGLGQIGLMLAYTPLHALLLAHAGVPEVLVMTSANPGGEPLCTQNNEALIRLRGIADGFLLHNRPIVTRVDDSVARIMDGKVRLLRRARGYAPAPMPLRAPCAEVLACGGGLKNTVCLIRGDEAYLSQHIGDLANPAAFDFFRETIGHLEAVLERHPHQLACDLHPDYPSTRYARQRDRHCRPVQHHHAHIGAVLAEHGLEGEVLGVVLDGSGYGGDGSVWGGEICRAGRDFCKRLARLSHLPLPGGDRAAQEPWRMGMALLYAGLGPTGLDEALPPGLAGVAADTRRMLVQMMRSGLNSPPTSSCGRLFDAVASLLGLCQENLFEGHAAMLLEHQATLAAAKDGAGEAYPVRLVREDGGLLCIDSRPLAALLVRDLAAGVATPVLARRFHLWLAVALTTALIDLRQVTGLERVVLSGGCMQNKFLFETLCQHLRDRGFWVYAGEMVPMNDGGLALGQAFIGGSPCV